MSLGPTELILILAIAILIFGVGKVSEVGGALGKSVREFRKAVTDEHAPPQPAKTGQAESAPVAAPHVEATRPPDSVV